MASMPRFRRFATSAGDASEAGRLARSAGDEDDTSSDDLVAADAADDGDGAGEPPEEQNKFPIQWLVLGLVLAFVSFLMFSGDRYPGQKIAYSVFREEVRKGNVEEITEQGQYIIGTLRQPLAGDLTPAQLTRLRELETRDAKKAGTAKAAESGDAADDTPDDTPDDTLDDAVEPAADAEDATKEAGESGGDAAKKPSKPISEKDQTLLELAKQKRQFHTVKSLLVEDETLQQDLLEHDVKQIVEPRSNAGAVLSVLAGPLFFLFFLYLLFMMMRRSSDPMSSGMFGNFVRSPAKRFSPDDKHATFDDVAGMEYPKQELAEVVEFLKSPAKFTRLGAEIPKGVLLSGPPGTGKTLLARATAGEAGRPFFSINGSEFIQMFVGVGASRVRDMFQTAKKNAPCILFIDEIDAVGRVRGAGLGGGHDEREQTLNQILSEMDGFEPSTSVIVIGATNRNDVLDPALLRPGRFDRKIEVDLPSKDGRLGILKVHARKKPLDDAVDLSRWAAATIGFSGAELRNLVNEAALHAVREGHDVVMPSDFETAFDKIILGGPRSEKYSEREKRMTAYHEAGHALVAWLIPDVDPVHKVTIVPRGRTGGVTQFRPLEERVADGERRLHGRLAVMMGGRVAEDIIFNETTTGAYGDLMQATRTARAMVGKFGMSEQVGPVAFDQSDDHPFLGRELHDSPRKFSDETAHLMDTEVQRFLSKANERARSLCNEHREKLDAIAELLLKQEIVTDEDLEKIIGPAVERRHKVVVPDVSEANGAASNGHVHANGSANGSTGSESDESSGSESDESSGESPEQTAAAAGESKAD